MAGPSRSRRTWRRGRADARRRSGRVLNSDRSDVWVNNAMVTIYASIVDVTPADFIRLPAFASSSTVIMGFPYLNFGLA